MIRILVADDHAVVRQGVIQILAEVRDMLVKDEAQNSARAGQGLKYEYDVVLLDISMPGKSRLKFWKISKLSAPSWPC